MQHLSARMSTVFAPEYARVVSRNLILFVLLGCHRCDHLAIVQTAEAIILRMS